MRSDTPAPDTADLFRTLRRDSSLVTRVTEQIEGLILEGKLRVGDPLPPETGLRKRAASAAP